MDKKMASAMLNSVMFELGFSIIFVLQQMGLFKFGFMMTIKQIDLPVEKLGLFKAPLLGAAFAFGWTPCVRPILAAIFTQSRRINSVSGGLFFLSLHLNFKTTEGMPCAGNNF